MPYSRNAELPAAVRAHLPAHAQDVYRAAFNSAWEQYDQPGERRGGDSREAVAHKVAWTAVKQAGYARDEEGDWQRTDPH